MLTFETDTNVVQIKMFLEFSKRNELREKRRTSSGSVHKEKEGYNESKYIRNKKPSLEQGSRMRRYSCTGLGQFRVEHMLRL